MCDLCFKWQNTGSKSLPKKTGQGATWEKCTHFAALCSFLTSWESISFPSRMHRKRIRVKLQTDLAARMWVLMENSDYALTQKPWNVLLGHAAKLAVERQNEHPACTWLIWACFCIKHSCHPVLLTNVGWTLLNIWKVVINELVSFWNSQPSLYLSPSTDVWYSNILCHRSFSPYKF